LITGKQESRKAGKQELLIDLLLEAMHKEGSFYSS
jgi:hypothetical protein